MDRYDPYYAQDTDGVHFVVDVDGQLVQGYIGRQVLAQAYGVDAPGQACLATYRGHRDAIDEVVRRRVREQGPETVLVRAEEIKGCDAPVPPGAALLQRPAAR